jgi:hypothetical protein
MPQGNWNAGRRARAGVARAIRPALALSVLAALAACAQSGGREAPPRGVASHGSHYNRPASYDPPGPSHDPWGPWIRDASRRFDVPERWIREVMRQESGGRATATSRVGAMGLMQVMPGTYRELQSRYGLGDDPYHPYDSIMAGTAYIREMYELYGSPAFLAAYNAGPRRLEDYLWNSRGLPGETRNYVARIGPHVVGHHPRRRAAPEVYAAAEVPLTIPAGPRRMDSATMLALREQRQAVDPGIQVAQLPPGPVVRMDPIPDGSTSPPPPVPYQVAAAGPVVRMDPIPDGSTTPPPVSYNYGAATAAGAVVRMDPIPDGATPEGAARLAEAAAAAAPPPQPATVAAPARAAARAATPVPAAVPRLVAPAPPAARPGQAMLAAAALVPPRTPPAAAPGGSRGFGVVAAAQASTLPPGLRPTPAGGGWGVQVGAFGSEAQARSMAGTARDASAAPGSRATVSPLAQGRTILYRARVVGLSQSAAQQLCERMRARGACFVLSPDAQG